MKNALIAIFIGVLLAYSFGNLFSEWWGIHLMMGDNMLSPLENLFAFSIVGVVFVLVGVIVALSVFGTIALAIFACVAALIFAGISAIWPVALVCAGFWIYRKGQHSRITS